MMAQWMCGCGCKSEAKYLVSSYSYDPNAHEKRGHYYYATTCENFKNYLVDTAKELDFPFSCKKLKEGE